jgi:hypothetical protein
MSCIMANRVVLNCRKVSRSVTYTVTGSAAGRAMIVVDDDNNNDDHDIDELLIDDDGVITKDVGWRKGRFIASF